MNRKSERACVSTNIRTAFLGYELVDPTILKDKSDIALADFHESFEDRCGEEFHVNSSETRFLSVE